MTEGYRSIQAVWAREAESIRSKLDRAVDLPPNKAARLRLHAAVLDALAQGGSARVRADVVAEAPLKSLHIIPTEIIPLSQAGRVEPARAMHRARSKYR